MEKPLWRIEVKHVATVFVGFLLLVSSIVIAGQPVLEALRLNLASRIYFSSLDASGGEVEALREAVQARELSLLTDNLGYVEKQDRFALVTHLEELSALPISQQRETLLYVPKTNTGFWHLLDSDFDHHIACYATPLLVPAITGMPMVNGLPGSDCDEIRFGYSVYSPKARYDSQIIWEFDTLCQKALSLGFSNIVILDSSDGRVRSERLDCGS